MKQKFSFASLRISRRLMVPVVITAAFAMALMAPKAQAQTIHNWSGGLGAGPFNWNQASSWATADIPDTATERGNLKFDWTAAPTINFTTATTVNGILFDDTGSSGDVAGTLANQTITLAGTTPVIEVAGSTLTISSVIAGNTAWSKTGGGTLILTGANTGTGAITVTDGVLRAASANAINTAASVTVTNVAPASGNDTNALQIAGGFTFNRTLTLVCALGGGQGRSALVNQSGNNTWSGNIIFENLLNQTLQSDSGTLTISGNISNGTTPTSQFFLRGSSNGVLTGTMNVGNSSPFKTDGGTWQINSTGNVHGTFGLSNGTIVVNNNNALNPLVGINFGENASTNTGVLTINSGFTQAFTAVNVTGGSNTSNGHRIGGAGTLSLGSVQRTMTIAETPAANDLSISTPIIGSGGFLKQGPGTLLFNGPSIEGPVTVAAGVFAVSGELSGGLAVDNTGVVVPGTATQPVTLTASTLELKAGSTLRVNLGEGPSDLIQVTSANGLSVTGTSTIQITPTGGFDVGDYPIIQYSGSPVGVSNFAPVVLPAGVTGSLADTGSAIVLRVTAVRQLQWTGAVNGTWDTTTQNWVVTGGGGPSAFTTQDEVIFTDGSPPGSITNTTLTLTGTVDPTTVEFAADTTNYTLASGTLSGAGAMSLIKSGDANLVLRNANTYTGATIIEAGTVELDHDGGTLTATSGVDVATGAVFLLTDDDGGFTFSRSLSGGGTVRVNPHSTVAGTTAVDVVFNGTSPNFSGELILESPLSGSSRLQANPAALGTALVRVENENQIYLTGGGTAVNDFILTGDGYNDNPNSIGALRMDGGTLQGDILVSGTAGNSFGSSYDARIGSNGGTLNLNGVVSGGDLSLFSFQTSSSTFVLSQTNSYGDTIIGGAENAAAGGQALLVVGDNAATVTNTTGTLGSGNVYLVPSNNGNPKPAILRIRRADGYQLTQDVIAMPPTSLGYSVTRFQAETAGTGLTLDGCSVSLSDGTNGGQVSVGVATEGSILNLTNGTSIDTGLFFVGDSSGRNGTVNHENSTVTVINQLRLGHYGNETGTYNLHSGFLSITGAAPLTTPSSTSEVNGGIYIGIDGTGVLNQTGGTVTTNFVVLDNRTNTVAGTNQTGVDEYLLLGGELKLRSSWGVIQRNPTTAFTLGGGAIRVEGTDLSVPLDTSIQVNGIDSVLDTTIPGNSLQLVRDLTGTGTVTFEGGGEIQLNPVSPSTISAVLAGTNPVAKIGTGSATIASASPYTGMTSVRAGRLNVSGSLPNSDVVVSDGAVMGGEGTVKSLVLGETSGSTLMIDPASSEALTSMEGVTVLGTNTVDFTATPTSGSFTVLNHNGIFSGSTANFQLANAGNYRSAVFSVNPMEVTLNIDQQSLTWVGTDPETPGIWDIAVSDNWSNGGVQRFYQGDTVNFDDSPGTPQTVTLTGTLQPSSLIFTNNTVDYTLTGSGSIGGTATILKSGTATVTLGTNNTFAGSLSVAQGLVRLSTAAPGALGASGNQVSITGTGQLDLAGASAGNTRGYSYSIEGQGGDGRGALINTEQSLAAMAGVLNLTLTGDARVAAIGGTGDGNRFDIGYNNAIFGEIEGNGFTLTKGGNGLISVRTPANNISYVVAEGTLRAENSDLALGSTGVTVMADATLDSYGARSYAVPVRLEDRGRMTGTNNTATYTGPIVMDGLAVFAGGATLSLNTNLTEEDPSTLRKEGTGTLILNGANTYSGNTELAAGILIAANAGALSSTDVVFGTGSSGRLQVAGGVTIPNDIRLGEAGVTNVGVGLGHLGQSGTGQGTIGGKVTIWNATTSGGHLIGGTAVGNELVLAGGLDAVGSVNVTQRDGRVIYSGGGVATGSSMLATGTVLLGADEGLPSGLTLNIGFSGNCTFDLLGHDQTLSNLNRQANTTTVTNTATEPSVLTLDVATTGNYSGGWAGNLSLVKTGAGTFTLSGTAPGTGIAGNVTVEQGTLQVSSQNTGLGQGLASRQVIVQPGATLELNTNNVFGNGTTAPGNLPELVINGGLVTANQYNVLGAVTLNGGILRDVRTGVPPATFEAFELKGKVRVVGSAPSSIETTNSYRHHLVGALEFEVNDVTAGADLTVSAGLRDSSNDNAAAPASLVKTGAGTMVLSAANAYTAGTTVAAGTLLVNNTTGSGTGTGAVSVGANGTLGGTGSVSGNVTVDGQVDPGVTLGQLSVGGNVSFASGSKLVIDLNDSASPVNDQLTVTGTLSATGATLDLNVTGALSAPVYVLATYTGATPTGFTAVDVPSGYVVNYAYNGNSIALVQSTGGSAYASWAALRGLTAGVNDGENADPDQDGVPNLLEFATDGDPLDPAANLKVKAAVVDVDPSPTVTRALTITLPVRVGAVFNGPGDLVSGEVDGVVYKIQASTNLQDFTTLNVTEVTDNTAIVSGLNLPPLSGSGWTYRTFRAPGTPGVQLKEFIRMGAE